MGTVERLQKLDKMLRLTRKRRPLHSRRRVKYSFLKKGLLGLRGGRRGGALSERRGGGGLIISQSVNPLVGESTNSRPLVNHLVT